MMNGKSTATTKAPAETNLDEPCSRCGHIKDLHALFVDNQTNSASYKPERRHCLHLSGDGVYRLENVCECTKFAPVHLERREREQHRDSMARQMGEPYRKRQAHESPLAAAIQEVADELARARAAWPAMHSIHEGYALIAEELDELWTLVKVKQDKHDRAMMRREAMQIAAMAIRFMEDLCDGEAH